MDTLLRVRQTLSDPPTVAELAELTRGLALHDPSTLPTLLWCLSRSARVLEVCRRFEPTGAHLAAIQRAHPAGATLVSSFRAGADRLVRWAEASSALDEVLPPIAKRKIPPLGDD